MVVNDRSSISHDKFAELGTFFQDWMTRNGRSAPVDAAMLQTFVEEHADGEVKPLVKIDNLWVSECVLGNQATITFRGRTQAEALVGLVKWLVGWHSLTEPAMNELIILLGQETMGARVRVAREVRGLSREELAARLNDCATRVRSPEHFTPETIASLEEDTTDRVSVNTLVALQMVLDRESNSFVPRGYTLDPKTGDWLKPEPVEGYEQASPGWQEYPLDSLAIRDERRTAQDVVRRIEQDRFLLDPDFQRDFVWDTKKQSRLIESILMRIPLPVFYVAEDPKGRLVVVDGRQRLTTLQRFFAGQLKLDLDDRVGLRNLTFQELDPRLQNRIEDCQLHFYIIDHAVPERARLDIFERVNGGEVLTRQQMRNAIYNGPATDFLRDEASSDLFKEATGQSLDSKKMQDREFVNRFCSFTLLPVATYKGDMDAWLSAGLTALDKMDEAGRAGLHIEFVRALQNNLAVFGKHAFRKHRQQDQSRSVINASLFDVMSTGMSRIDHAVVKERSDRMRQAFYARMNSEMFMNAITYSPNTPNVVRQRFEIASEMFREVFDAS